MGQKEDDYKNKSLAILLEDIKRGGPKEVTDEYFLSALDWPLIRRYETLPNWVERFAARHELIYTRDKKQGRYSFIRSKF